MAFQKTAVSIVWWGCIALGFLLFPILGWTQHIEERTAEDFLHKADSLRYHAQFDSSNYYYYKAADLFADKSDFKNRRDILFRQSLNYADQGQTDAATKLLEKAHTFSLKHLPKDSTFKLRYFHQKGILAEAAGEYQTALDWLKRGLRLGESLGNISFTVQMNTGIGEVYTLHGNYNDAIELLSKAQDDYHRYRIEDEKLLSRIYSARGNAYRKKGEYKTAQKYFKLALDIDEKRLPHPHPELSKRFNNLALIYYYQSDYQRALDYMVNATDMLSAFHGKNHRLVATGFNNIGIVYSEIGDLEQAAEYLKKSLQINEEVLGHDHPEVAIGYKNIGAIYSDMEKYDEAIRFYRESEQVLQQQFPDGHPRLADIYANLGEAYSQKGSYKEALDFYFKDLEINRRMLPAEHPYIGDTYTKIGETYGKVENFAEALNYYRRAIEVLASNYNPEEPFGTFSLENTAYPELLLSTLRLKAETLYRYGKKSDNRQLLEQALQTYLQTLDFIDQLQQSLNRHESKFLLRERTADIYKKGFKTAFDLFKSTGNSDYKKHLFYFVQKSRNQILLEQIQQLDNQQFARIPDSLIVREKHLKRAVTDLQQQLFSLANREQNRDSLKRISLQDSLFHTQKALHKHLQKLEKTYPEYYSLKFNPPFTSVTEIQQKYLSSSQTMISYFLGEKALFAFVITKNSFDVREIVTDPQLQNKVSDLQKSIFQNASLETFSDLSYELYRELFEPLSDLIAGHHILIIPSGPLHYLPFESLLMRPPHENSSHFHKLPYLINDFIVTYVPSVGYIELRNQQEKADYQKKIIAFAPEFKNLSAGKERKVYPDYERTVRPLLFNKREVLKLQELFNKPTGFWPFPKSSKNIADIFVDHMASESTFKETDLTNYRYIHLATHAFLRKEQPARAGILFTTPDPNNDGTLYTNEIYNLELDADLVTLSACKTGTGPLAEGEGIIGLSRAFQFAGARNLLVTLWEINDRSTERLMVDFYARNKDGKPMAKALQEAKLQMINRSEYAHPRYWAPFIFIGQ